MILSAQVSAYQKLNLYLIKPSKYDDDGYVIRYWKGVLPSNTLACLNGLSLDVQKRQALGANLQWNIEVIDETVQPVDLKKISRPSRDPKTKTIVCLVGVQSNQFPRASDLALEFRRSNPNIDVFIGGFHVSGILATLSNLSPELTQLQEAGVTLVAGEIEGRWESLLRDALTHQLKPVYNFLKCTPDISETPMPEIPKNQLKRYAVSRFATLDCGRGCPYQCSFCTVIQVQGRKMRFRSVDRILGWIRENYQRHQIDYYFFTDDNFSRNKNWEAIFDGLIQLRKEENLKISFMMQVDTQSHKIERFAEKASLAGCKQVFIGMESLNEENLKSVDKKQNHVSQYGDMIRTYQDLMIATHLAYIIGFPFDNPASVQKDMEKLRNEIGAEQASFFMMTPLPGSMDYQKIHHRQTPLDADLNNYDTFHETFRHDQMKPGQWLQVYKESWQGFYHPENMKAILKRVKPQKYWDIFFNFFWYKNAIQVEKGHPMLHGFVRLKGRLSRRPSYPIESRAVYFKRRVKDFWNTISGWVKLAFEMEEVWLATRHRSLLEEKVLQEISLIQKQVKEWRDIRLSDLQTLYKRAASQLEKSSNWHFAPKIQIPNRLQLWIQKWNVFSDSLTSTRTLMSQFWMKASTSIKQGKIHELRWRQIAFMSFRESVLLSRFLFCVFKALVFAA